MVLCHRSRNIIAVIDSLSLSDPSTFLLQVDVGVLRFVPLQEPRLDVDFDDLETIVRVLFSMRRRMIRHAVRYVPLY